MGRGPQRHEKRRATCGEAALPLTGRVRWRGVPGKRGRRLTSTSTPVQERERRLVCVKQEDGEHGIKTRRGLRGGYCIRMRAVAALAGEGTVTKTGFANELEKRVNQKKQACGARNGGCTHLEEELVNEYATGVRFWLPIG